MIPPEVVIWLKEQQYGGIVTTHSVGGGCINNGIRLVTDSRECFFLKTNSRCPPDMFFREREGLEALAVPGGPRVPRGLLWGRDYLLLEDLSPAERRPDYWQLLGSQLAVLHVHTAPQFGFTNDNYIGLTPQPNPWTDDGFAFFAEQRLIFQAELAAKRNLLSVSDVQRVLKLAGKLQEWIPTQPASLIHGDLWSGNTISDEKGNPALIDPAAHYGWAEADLAMMVLFGSPPEAFFHAYREVRPIPAGEGSRFPIYNLYHLLNHLNLFGSGYYPQVIAVLRRLG